MNIILLGWVALLTLLVLINLGYIGPETNKDIKRLEGEVERLHELLDTRTLDSVRELTEYLEPFILDRFKPDIELVLKADFPGYEYQGMFTSLGGIVVSTYNPAEEALNPLDLDLIIRRASELRELQSKLCCKKTTKKTSKRSK